jgi:hypothetical protein
MVLMVRFKDDEDVYFSKEDRLFQYTKGMDRDEIISITYDGDSIVLFYYT